MTDLRRVRPREARTVAATGRDAPELVVAFLSELLVLQSDGGFLVREIAARPSGRGPTAVTATVRGEPFEAGRHPARVEVKAITMHALAFDPARGRARVIVDI